MHHLARFGQAWLQGVRSDMPLLSLLAARSSEAFSASSSTAGFSSSPSGDQRKRFTGYTLYVKQHFARRDGETPQEVLKRLGASYKALPDAEKDALKAEAAKMPPIDHHSKPQDDGVSRMSGYNLFVKREFAKVPKDDRPADMMQRIGAAYQNLTDDEVRKLKDEAAQMPGKPRRASPRPAAAAPGLRAPLTLPPASAKKKRNPTAFDEYRKSQYPLLKEANPGVTGLTLLHQIGATWKTMSEAEKQKFKPQ